MKNTLFILMLAFVLSIEAAPKKKSIIQPFTEWTYTERPFTVTQYSPDEAQVSAFDGIDDGVQGPIPFRVIRGEMSQQEFRNTLIFITDNLSEAYFH